MVARLWWKDLRQLWPIWALLALFGLAVQGLTLHFLEKQFLSEGLYLEVLGLTCLYAFAVGAAAFAGERENRTLGWLDAIPGERWRVWIAKVSLAVISTLALGLLLLIGAVVLNGQWMLGSSARMVPTGALILVVVLGCGLFWSSFSRSALLAAVLSITTSTLLLALVNGGAWTSSLPPFAFLILCMAAFYLASFLIFRSLAPPRRQILPALRARSIETAPAEAAPRFSIAAPAARSLIWQTMREARSLSGWLILVSLLVPPATGLYFSSSANIPSWILAGPLVCLIAGVSVFGNDLRRGSQRVLANHGVHPWLVWLIRVVVWFVVVLGVVAFGAWVTSLMMGPREDVRPAGDGFDNYVLQSIALGMLGFSVPVVCGMVFRRGITATVVAILMWFLVAVPLLTLHVMNLLPPICLIVAPLAILGISLAWSGDWLIERPGAGRWLRLAAWSLGLFAICFAGYASLRVLEVPQLDKSQEARLFGSKQLARVADADNAAVLYRQASDALSHSNLPTGSELAYRKGPAGLNENVRTWLHANGPALELLRQGASKKSCQFRDAGSATLFSSSWIDAPYLSFAGWLVEASIIEQLGNGDLDGAWRDILVYLRMVRHRMTDDVGFASLALLDERRALRLAFAWAADPKQTVDRLRAARIAYQSLLPLDPAEPIRFEAQILRNTQNLPRSELRDKVLQFVTEPRKTPESQDVLYADLMTTPWELARTRRAWRLVLGWMIEQAEHQPWQTDRGAWTRRNAKRGTPWSLPAPPQIERVIKSSPLAQRFLPSIGSYLGHYWDRNEVVRLALTQVLALRAWQIGHGGQLPSHLDDLVRDGELDRLPQDPYTGHSTFGYILADGQSVLPIDDPGILSPEAEMPSRCRPVTSGRLLYSAGPDQIDERASHNDGWREGGDIIFPLVSPASGPTP